MTVENIMSSDDLNAGGAEAKHTQPEAKFPRKALVIGQVIKTYKFWVEVTEENVINYLAEFYPVSKTQNCPTSFLEKWLSGRQ